MNVSQQLLAQANQALELAQTRYKLGLGSVVELSQAQLRNSVDPVPFLTGTTWKRRIHSLGSQPIIVITLEGV